MSNGVIASLLQYQTFHLATLWKIERTDGVTYRLTDHDSTLEIPDDGTYTPIDGIRNSATQSPAGMSDRNQEFQGAITSSLITEDDLRAGRYRNAKVTELIVDFRTPWAEPIRTSVYWILDTQWNGEEWEGQAEGLTHLLKQPVGNAYTRSCRWRLGDDDCGVDLDALAVNSTVASVSAARRVFVVTNLDGYGVDYFKLGLVTFTSGNNNNLVGEIKAYDDATGQLELQLKMPFDVQVGDSVTVTPGCNLTSAECNTKFSNIANFGGFPFVPGADRFFQTPDAK